MDLMAANAWPVWVAALLLGVAAVINARTLTVPNWLTLGGVLSGWVVGALASAGALPLRGGLGPSLAATAIGFGVLIPWASRGALGVGCVKAQMAFGAWLGCAADFGSAATAAIAAGVAGALTLGVFGVVAARRRTDRSEFELRWSRLPAQVPLSLGSVAGAALALSWA
jgi:prepilin signal peptidase PulO-like enzyme (type II secretory pathway)